MEQSEDDGQGGRRKKKGLKDKIMEKLPGGHSSEEAESQAAGRYGGGYEGAQYEPEKKGIMEKIKEKLPGHHN